MDDVTSYSKKIKAIADEILEKTDLISVLSEFGEVIVCGSYKYDLMWGPDIDIIVKCVNPDRASKEAIQKLIKLKLFQKYEYGDFVNFKREGRPESYIVNLRLPYNGQAWEIETWFFENIPTDQIELDKIISTNLNDQNRQTILQIKKMRDKSEFTKHQISSATIYKKVLIEKMDSIEKIIASS